MAQRKTRNFKISLSTIFDQAPLNIKAEYMELLASGNTSANRKQTNSDNSSIEIDTNRKDKIDQALIRFFVCCGIHSQ